MKKTTALAFFFAAAFCSTQAQVGSHPFPTENAYWHTSLGCFEPYYEEIYTCQDTLMDGVAYSQLHVIFYAFNWPEPPGIFCGGLRSDGDKVWLKPAVGSDELLLYDFSVQVGDTVRLWRHFLTWSSDTLVNEVFKVTSIDSVLLNDGWHRRWKASCSNDYYNFEIWIEGLGSTYGVFDRYVCEIFGSTAKVSCLWHNGQTTYSAFPGVSCDNLAFSECLIAVNTAQPEQSILSVYPNPFSDFLNISFSEDMPPLAKIKLFDALGRELEVPFETADNSIRLGRGKLPRGVYFLKVENGVKEGGISVFKIVAE